MEEDEKMTDEEIEEQEKNKEDILMEIKANTWFKMIYHLTKGDITKTDSLMKTNANYVFHILGFEKSNQKWVSQYS